MVGNLLTEKYILQNILTVLRQTAYALCKVCITKHFALSALCLVCTLPCLHFALSKNIFRPKIIM